MKNKTLILCAGANESFSFAQNIGIGLIQASIMTTKLCLKYQPCALIFIGSCGLYDKNDELLKIYESHQAYNIEYAKLSHSFYSPAQCEIKQEHKVSYETYVSNSSNYICTDEKAAGHFLSLGLRLENMEIFSVLSVAAHFGIRAKAFLCASNYCDEKAHHFFVQYHNEVKKNLEYFLEEHSYI